MDTKKNNSQDFTYPDIDAGSKTPAAQAPIAPTPAVTPDPATPAVPTPPVAQPTQGQQVSGPSFDDVSQENAPEEPVEVPITIQPDPTRPEAKGATEEVVEEKKEEKKNPLKALADKLNALKGELIEEVPAKQEEVKEEPTVPVEVIPEIPAVTEGKVEEVIVTPDPIPELVVEDKVKEPVVPEVPEMPPLPEVPTPVDTPVQDVFVPAIDPLKTGNVATPLGDGIVKDDLSSIMPERPNSEEVVIDSEDIEEVADAIPEATLESEDDDMTQTGPDAIQEEAPKETKEEEVVPVVEDEIKIPLKPKGHKPGKYPYTIIQILDMAIQRDASDIQISVGYPVMIRIDGTLIAISDDIISPTNSEELILPVLSEQKKELLEVNREVDLAYAHQNNVNARFRINAYYSREHLAAAFRLIPSKIRTIDELRLPPMYKRFSQLKQGLVLITGPTGHGKSTTLAAILQEVNTTRADHMITIEDPIEYIFPKAKAVIDQREMHDDTHSWTIALKSALRQDPDIILVGEMRDYETIAATITLAETGHLVFATLHTNSAAQTIDRIIDVFPENQQAQIRTQLANILEAVVAQRLIPLDEGGRQAVSEIMLGTPAVRNLIREGKTHQLDNVIRTSADVGMVSLESSLVKLVREGKIAMNKAQEYAVHPEEVVRLLKN